MEIIGIVTIDSHLHVDWHLHPKSNTVFTSLKGVVWLKAITIHWSIHLNLIVYVKALLLVEHYFYNFRVQFIFEFENS